MADGLRLEQEGPQLTYHEGAGTRQKSRGYRDYKQWVCERRRERPASPAEHDIMSAIWMVSGSEAEAYARAGTLLAGLEEATAPIYGDPGHMLSEIDDAERAVLQDVLPVLAKEMGEKLRTLSDMECTEAYEIMLWFVQRKRGY